MADRLDTARQAVEGRFLEAGEVLGSSVEGVGQLIASLDKLTRSLDQTTVEATTGELKTAARRLTSLPQRHTERREIVERLSQGGEALALCVDDMRRNLDYLRFFAINIKITAGGVAAADTEFGLFAQEMSDYIELGRTHLTEFDRDLKALAGELKAAVAQDQALAERCHGLIPEVPDGLSASAEALESHHAQVAQAATEVTALARAVQSKVGLALAALQVGDITRQRIEHVQEALTSLAEVEDLEAEPRARLKAFIHGLLAAQLRAAGDDFQRDVSRINQSMTGIAGDALAILRLRDLALGRAKGDDSGFLKGLERHVARAVDLVAQVEQADRGAEAIGASAAAAVAGLSAHITDLQRIRTDVQQMALNTTLKCGRIGDAGKPLAVIAVELRAEAGGLEAAAHEALTALQTLAGQAQALVGTGDVGTAEGADQALAEAAGRLRGVSDAMEADLQALAVQGDAVVQSLRQAASRLSFQQEIGAIMDEAAEVLGRMPEDEPCRVDDLGERLSELLGRISRSYTMVQEREVHRRFTDGLDLGADEPKPEPEPEPEPAKPVAATADEDEFDDVLF